MNASRVSRLLLVTVLLGTALGLSQQSAGATGSTPPPIHIPLNDRFVDVDASNDGLIAYTVAKRNQPNSRIRKSTDGGFTWPEIMNAPLGAWSAVSTSTNGATVAIVGEPFAGGFQLSVSTNSGSTWMQKGPTNSAFHDVAVSGDGETIVIAQHPDGVSYSNDGGDTWTQATTSANSPLMANESFVNVAVNENGMVMVANSLGGSIWRSADGGLTWVDLQSTRLWGDIAISDDGATVFGVTALQLDENQNVVDGTGRGYIWTASSNTLNATPLLGFEDSQAVSGAISPDGRSFIAASYNVSPRVLRNWNPSIAPNATTWTTVSAGTAVLGLTITNAGDRFITVTEQGGIYTYTSQFPAPVITSASDFNCDQPASAPVAGGTKVFIRGRNFYDATVSVGGQTAPVVDVDDALTEIVVTAPPGVAGTTDIVINAAGGSVTLPGGFTYVTPPQNWSRLGSSITNTSVEYAGTSLAISSDGNTLAIGSPWYDVAGVDRGRVRIMKWNGSGWIQQGTDLVGTSDNDNFGMSVALDADGDTVVIGAHYNNGGYASAFRYSTGSWSPLGVSVSVQNPGAEFGHSVAISADGNTIAVGAPYDNGGGSTRGQVRVYDFVGASWSPRGVINGEIDSGLFGRSLAISADGDTVVAGAPSAGNGSASVHRYGAGSWTRLGSSLTGRASGDQFGGSVAISANGNTIAVGARNNDDAGHNRGQVRIYEWSGSSWTNRGIINGDTNSARSGSTVAMSVDGNTIAYNSNSSCRGGTVGSVVVREFRDGQWQQRGGSIDSPFADFGFPSIVSLSGSGDVVAASNPEQNLYRGAVAAWRYTPPVVNTPPVFVVPPSSSAPSTSTPGTSAPPTAVESPSVETVGSLPVGDPVVLFGRTGRPGESLPLRVGEQLNVTLDDFTPNEDVWIGLFSNPVTIATVKADARGVLSTAFAIPSGITGDHTLVIYGTESGNGIRIPVQLTAPTLPVTGPNTNGSPGLLSVLATLILTLGLTLLIWVSKRTLSVRSTTQNAKR